MKLKLPFQSKPRTQTTAPAQVAPETPQDQAIDTPPQDRVEKGRKGNPVLSLGAKAGKAVFSPVINFVARTVTDTALTAGISTALAVGTMAALPVVGPAALLIPAAGGAALGVASRGHVKKVFKNKKDARFEPLSTGVAYAAMGYGALIAGPTLAGVATVGAGVGAIYGGLNSLMVQGMEAMGVINKAG